jgi:hypothetical protein
MAARLANVATASSQEPARAAGPAQTPITK